MIRILTFETNKEKWFLEAAKNYKEKIGHYYPFDRVVLKSPSSKNLSEKERAKIESELLLEKTKAQYLILCDERGKSLDSHNFSKKITKEIESGNRSIDFIIGGAFGVTKELREKADLSISLAPFVMNHLVAQTVLMEQIYRAFTIWKGHPYHNE